jgi:ornithine cyclodeaminase/alanine dehydrogenase-like protein (mu-crystallin family)
LPAIYLTDDDVNSLLPMNECVSAMREVFRKFAMTEVANISRGRARTDHGMLHVMGSAAKSLNAAACKVYMTTKSRSRFLLHLYDGRTGELRALIEADRLGAIRTGAVSSLATDLMARSDASTLGLIGAGKQAATQLEGVAAARKLTIVRVFSRDSVKRKAFAESAAKRLGLDVRPVESASEAIVGADLIVTATTSSSPVISSNDVTPGAHLNVVGSNFLGKIEVDPETVRRAGLVVVEDKEQARIEAGDLIAAVEAGVMKWSTIRQLGDVVAGVIQGRGDPDATTLFKSVGSAMEDLAAAKLVVDKAIANGVGIKLPF